MTKSGIKSETEHQRQQTSDPVLSMLGIGRQLWGREPGDSFVKRLRIDALRRLRNGKAAALRSVAGRVVPPWGLQ